MYQKNRTVPGFSRRGQIIATPDVHRMITDKHPKVYKRPCTAKKSVAIDRLIQELRNRGLYYEMVYDAAKGNAYLMFIFTPAKKGTAEDKRAAFNVQKRKEAFDFICAPESGDYKESYP